MSRIVVRGARQHNLKNITVEIPKNRIIVVTGVSGSGKSSLVFDVLYVEARRRYLESLGIVDHSDLAVLMRNDKPRVDHVEGLTPAIALQQRRFSQNPRSTVGTLTETLDSFRVLYARFGTLHCPQCGNPVRASTLSQMVSEISTWPQGTRLFVCAPLGRVARKKLPALIQHLRRRGFVRIRIHGHGIHEIEPPPPLPILKNYLVDVIVDRIVLRPSQATRLKEACELAAGTSGGWVSVLTPEGEERRFSQRFQCPSCQRSFPELSQRLFSHFHPEGACPECKGTGTSRCKDDLGDCPQCHGSRVNETARSVVFAGWSFPELLTRPVSEVKSWITSWSLTKTDQSLVLGLRKTIIQRLETLERLHLDYLSLGRSVNSLSVGEAQRLRLCHQLSIPLSGILYILDEPATGLHPEERRVLFDIYEDLKGRDNTVLIVEHDFETILRSDWVVDMGPWAGERGGQILYSGPPSAIKDSKESITARFLTLCSHPSTVSKQDFKPRSFLRIRGAKGRNLRNIDVTFPHEAITCIAGPSGSGKSTLVMDTLYPALTSAIHGRCNRPALPFDGLEGADAFDNVILVDQSPLGRTPRSTPATYVGAFTPIRHLFAQLPEARTRGYGPQRFSFNTKGGRCESCSGEGRIRIDMAPLPDVTVTCPVCSGRRFDEDVLNIRFKGFSIADILDMTASAASRLFRHFPSIHRTIQALVDVGLGYLRLGQPANTLSGGEAQRVKLARELSRKPRGHALYIFDEPTSGLHPADIHKLIVIFSKLIKAGHTLIVVEHHPQLMAQSDWIVELGPGGGPRGGHVIAAGTPTALSHCRISPTGRMLQCFFRGYLSEVSPDGSMTQL